MGAIADAVRSGRILISDGAWGTLLQQQGLKPGECPERWCLDQPSAVQGIAARYLEAGADLVETNSFGGNRFKLEPFGLAAQVTDINRAAARLSRAAAGRSAWVLGSIGPTGKMLLMGDVSEDALREAFREQATALADGGADACCIETMTALDEALLAVEAVREATELEIVCTFTFDRTVRGDYRSMMGVSPAEMARALQVAGADIVGTNCGNGMERMIDIVRDIREAAPTLPILVHANAGMPRMIDGVDMFPETPAMMAAHVPALISAGANILGGCCGTSPEHIRALVDAVKHLKQ